MPPTLWGQYIGACRSPIVEIDSTQIALILFASCHKGEQSGLLPDHSPGARHIRVLDAAQTVENTRLSRHSGLRTRLANCSKFCCPGAPSGPWGCRLLSPQTVIWTAEVRLFDRQRQREQILCGSALGICGLRLNSFPSAANVCPIAVGTLDSGRRTTLLGGLPLLVFG